MMLNEDQKGNVLLTMDRRARRYNRTQIEGLYMQVIENDCLDSIGHYTNCKNCKNTDTMLFTDSSLDD